MSKISRTKSTEFIIVNKNIKNKNRLFRLLMGLRLHFMKVFAKSYQNIKFFENLDFVTPSGQKNQQEVKAKKYSAVVQNAVCPNKVKLSAGTHMKNTRTKRKKISGIISFNLFNFQDRCFISNKKK